MSKRAAEIAQAHIQKANPTLWDGMGNRPAAFDNRIATYSIDQDTELDISFEYENGDGWLHLCELRDKHTDELLESLHGYGIDSPLNLSDTIEDICDGRLTPVPPPAPRQEDKRTKQPISALRGKFWRSTPWNKKK